MTRVVTTSKLLYGIPEGTETQVYIVRSTSPATSSVVHAKTAKEALEVARPHEEAGRHPIIEKDGLLYSFRELELAFRSAGYDDDG